MADITIKQGNTLPALRAILTHADGEIIDLNQAVVRIHIASVCGGKKELKTDELVEVVESSTGSVQYNWKTADTAVAGSYQAEFEITFQDGKVLSVPNEDYFGIHVVAQLA